MPKRKGRDNEAINLKIKRLKVEPDLSTVSEYERKRLENIRKNNELLAELNIGQARQDLTLASKPPPKQINMKKKKKVKEHLPRRKSLRLRRLAPDGVTSLPDPLPTVPTLVEQPRHRGKVEMTPVNDVDDEDSEAFLNELEGLMKKAAKSAVIPKKTLESPRYNKLQIKSHHVAKVVPAKVYSIEFHKMQSKVLLFAGDKFGKIGIWDINSKKENNIFVYEPHVRPIINMAFDPLEPTKLVTASYDGTIRCGDFSKAVFDEVFALDEDDSYFTYFGFGTTSSHTVLASTADGQVRIVDYRKKGDFPHYQLHYKSIKCLDVNPQKPEIFLTTTNKGEVAVWDIRKVKGPSSCLSSIQRNRSVSSSFFSPQTGQQILTTGMDNFITVNDVSPAGIISQTSSCTYRHDNQTGRWLATFHAKWDPKNETCFAVGSMKYPRQLDIFSTEIKHGPLTQLRHENFTTINSRIAFHPTLNMIAGGNSSGKVWIWSE